MGYSTELVNQLGSLIGMGRAYELLRAGTPSLNPSNFGLSESATAEANAAAVSAAVAALTDGGVIEFPEGTFTIEGIPIVEGISYIGQGVDKTTLQLPDEPTSHLFVAEAAGEDYNGGAIRDMTLVGGDTEDYDGVNFEQLNAVNQYWVERVAIDGFRGGVVGPGDIDEPTEGATNDLTLRDCYVSDCDRGFVMKEHGRSENCVYVRCRLGITGRITDAKILNNYFALCSEYGIHHVSGGPITIAGNQFWDCAVAARIISGVTFTANVVFGGTLASNGLDSVTGLEIWGSDNTITANGFAGDFTTALIQLAGGTVPRNKIIGNNFIALSGVSIRGLMGSNQAENLLICGNSFDLRGTIAIDMVLPGVSTTNFRRSAIAYNFFNHVSGTNNNGIVRIHSTQDLTFAGNYFEVKAGTCSTAINLSLSGDFASHLRLRGLGDNVYTGFTTPVAGDPPTTTELTIASGAIAIGTEDHYTVDTESDGATDDLVTITGGVPGQVVTLSPANSSRTVVFKHNTGTNEIQCGSDQTGDNAADVITLRFNGTNWQMLSFAGNGA